jgi:transcription antitermination factor NusG
MASEGEDTTTSQHWYIARCLSGQDQKAAQSLHKRGYIVKSPVMPITVKNKRGERRREWRPIFPGYIFALQHEQGWEPLRTACGMLPGRAGLMTINGKYASIADDDPDFQEMLETVRRLGKPQSSGSKFKAGDRVQVRKGAFVSFWATVRSLNEKTRIAYLEDMLGRKVRANVEHLHGDRQHSEGTRTL